jgi:hypothetical protein
MLSAIHALSSPGRADNRKKNLSKVQTMSHNQSVAPDGPSMPPPTKKETWVAGKQEGQAGGRQSYRQIG